MKVTNSVTKGDLTELKATNKDYYLYDKSTFNIVKLFHNLLQSFSKPPVQVFETLGAFVYLIYGDETVNSKLI